jgi:outer membrane receptor protein involved in Fe transport
VLTSENLQRAGISTATDAIRSISADGAGSIGTGFQSGFSAGGSAVSLRGLGVSSTLVLVDGLRSTNFPINDDGHNAYVDLNSIPFSLIERIEVLKDGASSSYGADAIGGVVNLKLKQAVRRRSWQRRSGRKRSWRRQAKRADITLGYGDYAESGWNVYVNAEYPAERPGLEPQPWLPLQHPGPELDRRPGRQHGRLGPDHRHAERRRDPRHADGPEQPAGRRRWCAAHLAIPVAEPELRQRHLHGDHRRRSRHGL